MTIEENVPLAPLTTFKVGGNARYFCAAKTEEDVREAIVFAKEKRVPLFVLGGGSNLLVSDAGFVGLVLKNELKGMEFDGTVTVAAGEIWDEFVAKTVERGLWGLENLSAIPGTVGAAPIQNIGAYGTEVKDAIESVVAIHSETADIRTFTNLDCKFGYRDSFFKSAAGKKYIVVSVTFRLDRTPRMNITYKDLRDYFADKPVPSTQKEIRDAVISIRAAKFPDLSVLGTAGSFWKNPVLHKEKFEHLLREYPGMPSYPADNKVKVPLAWILDKVCNLKGYARDKVALFDKQPLVLVAKRGATEREIKEFEMYIEAIVKQKTAISVEPEVQFLG